MANVNPRNSDVDSISTRPGGNNSMLEDPLHLLEVHINVEEAILKSYAGGSPFWTADSPKNNSRDSKSFLVRKLYGDNEPPLIRCAVCDEVFDSAELVNAHFNFCQGSRHVNSSASRLSTHLHRCIVCGKELDSEKDLKQHLKSHPGQMRYACGVCQRMFIYEYQLKAHQPVHEEELPATDFAHFLQPKVKLYKPTKSGNRPHECNLCEKQFARRDKVIEHQRTHSGERPFSCDQCEKKFARKVGLVLHQRTHSGERPFECYVCEKTFTRKDQLNTHKLRHFSERL